ncbi:MAG: GNAT family N-acetyltransferase/peptidase C39 family protein [Oleiphilaceae bacterium]|nr:GNAT family N-acetyltransferase/peptidase C39 family protein [Oleiphilaceae bacterium]
MPLRPATLDDLPGLIRLEEATFSSDRISRRSFQRFLRHDLHLMSVFTDEQEQLLGYGLVLRHRGTSLARLYSLATDARARGQGIGRQLLEQLEGLAREEGCRFIRLEVRADNQVAIRLYESGGYQRLGRLKGYYEDGGDALQMEKGLHPAQPGAASPPAGLPYYPQSTAFTCGPAALMMAMHHRNPRRPLDRKEELRVWREANTVYMTTGPAGTSPFGLALAARHRGFSARVWASHLDSPFMDGVRSAEKQTIMQLAHETFLEDCHEAGVEVEKRELYLNDLPGLLAQGWTLVLLISTWRLNRNKAPHWVWLVDMDDHHAYFNDPDIDSDNHQAAIDNRFMPVRLEELDAMTRYGKRRYRAAVLIRQPTLKEPH